VTWSTVNPSVGIPGFNVDSETWFASIFASYPLIRSRRSSVVAAAGFDYVDQDVVLNGFGLTRDRVRMASLRLTGDMTDEASLQRVGIYSPYEPRWRLSYAMELRHGLDVISASPDCRPNPLACLIGGAVAPSRIEADPTPFLARFSAGAEFRPDAVVTFALDTQAQFSRDPLPAFEEIAAGSFSIGRGYDPGAVLGDSGVLTSFEIRYGSLAPKEVNGWALQPYLFSDVAFAWNEDPSRKPTNPDRLWSAGGGLRANWSRGLQSDLVVAVPFARPDLATGRGDVRILFSLTARLLPWRFTR